MTRRAAGVALALAWATGVTGAGAEESVGVAPVTSDEASASQDAVRAAVLAAVLRVAREQLPEDFVPPVPQTAPGSETAPGPEPEAPDDWLVDGLGDDPFLYATRFAILEDRGRRPAMFGSDPDAEFEYVMVVDVAVDAEAVRERLMALGALRPGSRGASRELTLVVEGLERYAPLVMLRRALEADRGVRSVRPVEFSPGRAVLAVDADRDAMELVADLGRHAPEGLQILAVEQGTAGATLLVDWRPDGSPAPGAGAE